MKKHRINAHPARRIYRKIARIESGVRQKTFGSCDLIKEGETGDAKCLAPSTLALPDAGLFLSRPLARYRAALYIPRCLPTLARYSPSPCGRALAVIEDSRDDGRRTKEGRETAQVLSSLPR
jgi:hypothetical protein